VPNAFNPGTTIAYDLGTSANVTLRIYDVAGRLVRVLRDHAAEGAGPHSVAWYGRSDHGERVASGVYYYRLEAGSFTETRSMVLLK
jgi:flagellar hook assembly protein FlgD